MTIKNKIKLIILTILTLGIYPIVIMKKVKQPKEANKLSEAAKITFNIEKLIALLGGDSNIAGVEYTHKKVKILVEDRKIINVESISKLKGISGILAGARSITIVVGNQAKLIAEAMQ